MSQFNVSVADLGDSVGRLVDLQAIRNVIEIYGHFFDSGDFEGFSDLFTEDAFYNISPDPGLFPLPVSGRDSIVASMSGRHAVNERELAIQSRHMSSNIVINDLTSRSASAVSFLLVVSVHDDGSVDARRSGTYVDRLRKENGTWRFASRQLHLAGVPRISALVDGLT